MCQERGYLHLGNKLRHLLLFLISYSWSSQVLAETRNNEVQALSSMARNWQNSPRSWVGSDLCIGNWIGINCSNFHVISITLCGLSISGTLSADIQNLPELVYLDLSFNPGLGGELPSTIGNLVKLKMLIVVGCSFSGSIPPELGKLPKLSFLGLNYNQFSGAIPGELGNLSSLTWFDLTSNQLSGSIPVSTNTSMGLDMLTKCQHFHLGNNNLSGPIPAELFHSGLRLRHVLFDNNKLTGNIPPTIGLVTTLEALQLDSNYLTGPVPSNLNNLTKLNELKLSNNQLTGPLPNLTGMTALAYVNLSNNPFDQSDVPLWISTLPSLTTLALEYLKVAGPIPSSLFSISTLQKAHLRTNFFNETLDLGSQYSSQLTLVDLQGNRIDKLLDGGFHNDLLLEGNPYCLRQDAKIKFCDVTQKSTDTTDFTDTDDFTPGTEDCWSSPQCPSDQQMSPLCTCSYPIAGTFEFTFITFSNIENYTYYGSFKAALHELFEDNKVPVSVVSIGNPRFNILQYFELDLLIFPSGKDRFDEFNVVLLASLFSNNNFEPPSADGYGPYRFEIRPYSPESRSKGIRVALIVGVAAGVTAALLIGLVVFALGQKRKSKKHKDSNQASGSLNVSRSGIPQLKGPRIFSFDELRKCTNSFSEANVTGSGSYGVVYRGQLVNGELVAVKRAQEGSIQGGIEFKTEIEMLSRVHHRNLVSLVGFCFDQNEQILVYEYVPNGSLRQSLSGKSGVQLDWKKRLRVALGAARGLTYLHDLAIPRIIHRDVKSSNILLDHNLNAKVSDFGLCKPLGDDKRSHISTQVKGTMGYLDPEYYMTQQLSERSDVYSFGVVMLELVTARKPIERGRYIVREVRNAMSISKDLCGLQELLDPTISYNDTLQGFKRYIDLAIRCVEESSADRPWMSDVAKEIESIALEAGMNPYISSGTNSSRLGMSRSHPYDGDAFFDHSGGSYPSRWSPNETAHIINSIGFL